MFKDFVEFVQDWYGTRSFIPLHAPQFGDQEKALDITFKESGKAIIFTSTILFFGFLVLLFSNNGPSVTIGVLISVTLFSAVVADLLLLPVLIRKFRH